MGFETPCCRCRDVRRGIAILGVMLARAEIEELSGLRRAIYGPAADELNVESLNRLAELEESAGGRGRVSDATPALPEQAQEALPETRATGDAGRRRRLWAWLIPITVAGSFAVGAVVGAQPQWLSAVLPSPQNGTGPPLSAEQTESYVRVAATQRWDDPEQVGLAFTFNQVNGWAGFMRDGDDYCVAIDEMHTITLLCQHADADAYPLRFEWESPSAGFSLYLKVDADGQRTATASAL